MRGKDYIADRFKRAVTLHVIKNFVTGIPIHVPLILGIHGPSGAGKTYQCEKVLSEMGVTVFLISGGQLENGTAGEPAKLIREKYITASRSVQKNESRAAVVFINDVDTSLGDWGEKVQTTINTQTVYGELMHLVDYPNSVEGVQTKRIPVILTGNDFTKLYEPLVRAGRMTAFEWNPSLQERAKIISGIFPELNTKDCELLVSEFPEQSVAFFSHLRSILADDILWKSIQEIGVPNIINYIKSGYEPQLNVLISCDYLIKTGREFLYSGRIINHLRK